MFEKFSDYMYSLLFTPLKKISQVRNQFYIFFRIIGKLFDDTKADIFRVREESMIASASTMMLSEHGKDREMPRLRGESDEGYRIRLSMKGIIAQKAGTIQGLLLCLKSLELDGEIIPYYTISSERWAEFIVKIHYSLSSTTPLLLSSIKNEIRKVKPASAKDNYLFNFYTEYKVTIEYVNAIHFRLAFYPRFNQAYLYLDGTWKLTNSQQLNAYSSNNLVDFYPVGMRLKIKIYATISLEDAIRFSSILRKYVYHYENLHRYRIAAQHVLYSAELEKLQIMIWHTMRADQGVRFLLSFSGVHQTDAIHKYHLAARQTLYSNVQDKCQIAVSHNLKLKQQITTQFINHEEITFNASYHGCISIHEDMTESETVKSRLQAQEKVSTGIIRIFQVNYMDNSWKMNGKRKLNGGLSIV